MVIMKEPFYFTVFMILLTFCVAKLTEASSSEEFSSEESSEERIRIIANYDRVQTPSVRVVTDLEVIYGSFGVPVEYWYNETRANKKDYLRSVPGCPQSIDGHPWIFYGNPARCYLAGHAGPCSFGEKLVITPGSYYGTCACQCVVDNKSGQLIFPGGPERFLVCVNNQTEAGYSGQIYDTVKKRCYKRFDQGHCESGSVITGWTDTQIVCLPICDFESSDWRSQEKKGRCTRADIESVAAPPLNHIAEGIDDCPSWKKYNNTLKKCIKKRKQTVNADDNVNIIIRKK